MPTSSRIVGLMVTAHTSFGRGILRGIRDYIRRHGVWGLVLCGDTRDPSQLGLIAPGQRVDGIVAQAASPLLAQLLADSGIPTVNVSGSLDATPLPRVAADDIAIGCLAAEHLLANGFRNFAFCGMCDAYEPRRYAFSRSRAEGFQNRLAQAGFTVRNIDADMPLSTIAEDFARLRTWLAKLPRPIGIMACNDVRGRHIVDSCQQINIRVPEEISVIGVDNDEIDCELSPLALSSVDPDFPHIGYEAAALLARIMAGEKVGKIETRTAPLRIVVRQSSDILAASDPVVAGAVRFIREHAHRPLQVLDVAEAVKVSRRSLERRFKVALGHAPHDEIRRAHLDRAQHLLAETDLNMTEIAQAAGFTDAKMLSMLFRQATNLTPTAYRRQHRQHRVRR